MSVNLFDKKYKSLKPIAGIPTYTSVDDTLSETSENPVQNKVVNEAIDKINSDLLSLEGRQGVSNPNLLDNAWFTVNQRGQSEYSGNIYTLDRWRGSTNTTIKVFDDYIELSNPTSATSAISMRQNTEQIWKYLKGLTVTLSINTDNIIKSVTVEIPSTLPTTNKTLVVGIEERVRYGLILNTDESFTVNAYLPNGGFVNIKAMKLELGSVSTLALDTAPDYATELLKCQRYFISIVNKTASYSGYSFSNTARIGIPLTTPMRTLPIINIDNISKLTIRCNGTQIIPTAVRVVELSTNELILEFTVPSIPANFPFSMKIDSNVSISADL